MIRFYNAFVVPVFNFTARWLTYAAGLIGGVWLVVILVVKLG